MQLFLTNRDGFGQIPCPRCSRPLLLALSRKGRWLVSYRTGFRVRAGKEAMLVCPDLACDHVERVRIAARSGDAVAFNPWSASLHFGEPHQYANARRTLSEVWEQVVQLKQEYDQTGNPKIPSLFRFWREEYRLKYWGLRYTLQQAHERKSEVVCVGKGWKMQGRVVSLVDRGLLIEPGEGGEPVYIALGTLTGTGHVWSGPWPFKRPALRFDFGGGGSATLGAYSHNPPQRFAVVGGHSVELLSVSPGGVCQVATSDPHVARALHLWGDNGRRFTGEVPAVLVERVYRVVRYAHVGEHRLHLISQGFGRVRVETKSLKTAEALQMNRCAETARRSLRWWKEYALSDITLEVVEIPDRLIRRSRQIR
ncbi:MAG: hypothetical protein ACOY94_17285 [Bacillota bacterium]